MNTALNISSSPHARDRWTTAFIMRVVVLALLPTAIMGVVAYGLNAFLVILVSVVSAFVSEYLFDKFCHKPDTYKDGSAVVTGLMLALCMSPNTPLYAPCLGSIFAIIVVKCCFGGLGKNFINPALAGRCFVLISFSKAVTAFQVDGVSTATPIADLAAGRAVNITEMFLGFSNGVIGSSILALLIGGLVLWAMDVIHGQICFSVLGGFTLFIALFGGQGFDPEYLLAQLCGGGVVMGAVFMATDYATSPVSRLGQTVYGLLIGGLGGLFRVFGTSQDSFSYSIIIGNLFTPLIDMYVVPKPLAYRRRAIAARQEGVGRKPLLQRIPRPVVVLAVITLIAGVALSGVFAMTKDTIEEQRRQANAASYQVVCPNATVFENDRELDLAVAELDGKTYGMTFGRCTINDIVVGKDDDGEIVGYVVSVTTSDGFEGNITLSLGIEPDGRTCGIAYTELNETPGMGMRCAEPAFQDQFNGRTSRKFVLNKGDSIPTEDTIDTVSGASTTSGAVVNAVNAGLDFFYNTVKGGE